MLLPLLIGSPVAEILTAGQSRRQQFIQVKRWFKVGSERWGRESGNFSFYSAARKEREMSAAERWRNPQWNLWICFVALSLWYSSSCGTWNGASSISKRQKKTFFFLFFFPPSPPRAALSSLDLELLPGILQSLLEVKAGWNTSLGFSCRNNKRVLKLLKANLCTAGEHFLFLFFLFFPQKLFCFLCARKLRGFR